MTRFILHYLLPLLLPFLIYIAYMALTRGRHPDWLAGAPWAALTGAGVALMAVSLVTWNLLAGSPPGDRYVPARFEDGRIVPGTTIEPDE